jgi:hypothetical protein
MVATPSRSGITDEDITIRLLMEAPTFDVLLGADVGMEDRGEEVGDHMLYMISTELVMMRPTVM